MLLSQTHAIRKSFHLVSTKTESILTKKTALETIQRYLREELPYEDFDAALCFLEDEYPICRNALMQLRCCILLEEFVEYEQRQQIWARHFIHIRTILR